LRIGTVDSTSDRYTSDLWLLDLDSGALRRLTHHPESESAARFSPDGRTLGFLAARGPHAQVFGLPLEGGESRQLFQFEGGHRRVRLVSGRQAHPLRGQGP
jgi:Tol biopolymer transport system component